MLVLSRFLCNPLPSYIATTKRVLRYLKGTIYLVTIYGGGKPGEETIILKGFTDIDFAGCLYTVKSISSYLYFFAGGVISVQVKRQIVVVLSTTKSKYYDVTKAGIEAV